MESFLHISFLICQDVSMHPKDSWLIASMLYFVALTPPLDFHLRFLKPVLEFVSVSWQYESVWFRPDQTSANRCKNEGMNWKGGRERKREEEREIEGEEKGGWSVGGPTMARRGPQRAVKASAAPCCPVGLLIKKNREGEQRNRLAKKVPKIVAKELPLLPGNGKDSHKAAANE